jgi:hypothetical protein
MLTTAGGVVTNVPDVYPIVCNLNVLLSRLDKFKDGSDPHSHTNYRYLSDSRRMLA